MKSKLNVYKEAIKALKAAGFSEEQRWAIINVIAEMVPQLVLVLRAKVPWEDKVTYQPMTSSTPLRPAASGRRAHPKVIH